MTIRATTDKVIIIPDAQEKTTASGLIVHQTRADNPTTGIIYSVGVPGDHTMEGIKVGQRAYFADMAGAEVTHEGVKYYILSYPELLGVEDV